MLPAGFTYVKDPRFLLSLRYLTSDNFVGRPIAGYEGNVCILTEKAATALSAVQDDLDRLNQGYHLKIFDAYRPVTAVLDFSQWAQNPNQQEQKAQFYPNVPKSELFKQGYLADHSSHSRGSTVDLTISVISAASAVPIDLDMGTIFDFFDEKAHTLSPEVSPMARKNRLLLKDTLEKHQLINYPLEWWHFTLANEPFPDTYFDFPVL